MFPWRHVTDEVKSDTIDETKNENPNFLDFVLQLSQNDKRLEQHLNGLTGWQFTFKIMSMSSQIYIVNIGSYLIHPITLLKIEHQWRIIIDFSRLNNTNISKNLFDSFEFKKNGRSRKQKEKCVELMNNLFLLNNQSYSEILSSIYYTFYKKFWEEFVQHSTNIADFTTQETAIRKNFEKYALQQQLIPQFKKEYDNDIDNNNDNSNLSSNKKTKHLYIDKKLTTQQLRHIHLAFLCHLILLELQFEQFQEKDSDDDEDDEDENENDVDDDCDMVNKSNNNENDNDKDVTVLSRLKKSQNNNRNNGLKRKNVDIEMKIDGGRIGLTARNVLRTLGEYRTFDSSYKIKIPKSSIFIGSIRDDEIETDIKSIQTKYCPMGNCAIMIVKDDTLIESHLKPPKVIISLNNYITKYGEIINLTGSKSLIQLLSDNVVKRSIDPFSTMSESLNLFVGLPMTCLSNIMKFCKFQDLVNFGLCSHLGYHISSFPQLWKVKLYTTMCKSLFVVKYYV